MMNAERCAPVQPWRLEWLEERVLLSCSPIRIPIADGLSPGDDSRVVLCEVDRPGDDGLYDNPVVDRALKEFQDAIADARSVEAGADVSGLGDFFRRVSAEGRIQVYVLMDRITDDAKAALQADGMTIELAIPFSGSNVVQGWLPYDAIDAVAAIAGVASVCLPCYGMTNEGDVLTAGDGILNSDDLRNLASADGTGVKAGVISGGMQHWTLARDTGDLPGTIAFSDLGSGDEGTAMLEIIHDIAPGAELYFAPAATNAEMVSAINWMRNQGVDVIVDDLTFYIGATHWATDSYFTDGPLVSVAREARAAVDAGIVYVTSAGNWQRPYDGYYYGNLKTHWQGLYAEAGSGWNDFDTSGGVDAGNFFWVYPGATIELVLQWSDPWPIALPPPPWPTNDYDLFLLNASGSTILKSSQDRQGTSDWPFERIQWTNDSESGQMVNIAVHKYSPSGSSRELEIFLWSNLASGLEYTTPDSLASQQAVEEVISVAAIDASDTGNDEIEPFSSQGPSTIYTDPGSAQTKITRDSLDVSGVDGVHTKIGSTPPYYFPSDPFFGTSAAAPHIAGIAALLLDIDNTLTPAQVSDLINDNAVDILSSGYDTTSGYGRADAIATITDALTSAPDLNANSDTGASSTDNLTRRDNSSSSLILQFTVTGTIDGAAVTVYADGTAIGSGTGDEDGTITITTNGTQDIADGAAAITVRQVVTDKLPSIDSPDLTVTIDTVGPTVAGTPSINDGASHRLAVEGIEFTFSEDVTANSGALEISKEVAESSWEGVTSWQSGATFTQPDNDKARWDIDDHAVDGSLRVELWSTEVTDLAGNELAGGSGYSHDFLFYRGDFDVDDDVDANDIDLLFRAVYNGNAPVGTYDLTRNGTVNLADKDELIHELVFIRAYQGGPLSPFIRGTQYGDMTLDGAVNSGDLSILAGNWGQSGKGWAQGDLTGDTWVNSGDLSLLTGNWMWQREGGDGLQGGQDPDGDLDGDGDSDLEDVFALLKRYRLDALMALWAGSMVAMMLKTSSYTSGFGVWNQCPPKGGGDKDRNKTRLVPK